MIEIFIGYFVWKYLEIFNNINESKVILVLTGENEKVDYYALKYLNRVIERKLAKEAIIFTYTEECFKLAKNYCLYRYPVLVKKIKEKNIYFIYRWYCVNRFNKNLFFTFTDRTKNNLLGRFIRETAINEKDTVCLALYNFRDVPEEV